MRASRSPLRYQHDRPFSRATLNTCGSQKKKTGFEIRFSEIHCTPVVVTERLSEPLLRSFVPGLMQTVTLSLRPGRHLCESTRASLINKTKIMQALSRGATLQTLVLDENSISDTGATKLGHCLRQHKQTTLIHLSLAMNSIKSPGACRLD